MKFVSNWYAYIPNFWVIYNFIKSFTCVGTFPPKFTVNLSHQAYIIFLKNLHFILSENISHWRCFSLKEEWKNRRKIKKNTDTWVLMGPALLCRLHKHLSRTPVILIYLWWCIKQDFFKNSKAKHSFDRVYQNIFHSKLVKMMSLTRAAYLFHSADIKQNWIFMPVSKLELTLLNYTVC